MATRRFTHYTFNNFVGMSDQDLAKARRHSTANVRLDPIPADAHSPTVKVASEPVVVHHNYPPETDIIVSDPWTPIANREVSPRRRGRVDPLPVIPGIVSENGPQSAPPTKSSTTFAPQPQRNTRTSSGLGRRHSSVSPTSRVAARRSDGSIGVHPRRASVFLQINGRDVADQWETRTPAELIASLRKEARGY
jgi:hypothetical protein